MIDYKKYVNSAIDQVAPSGIRQFFDIAASMKDVISLGVGEPDFKTPYAVRAEAIDSIVQGHTQYTANSGMESLRVAIADYLCTRFNLSYDYKDEILLTIGASEAIDLSLRALLNPGDEVLVPEPSYVSYSPNVIFAGGVPKPIITFAKDGFKLRPEEVAKAVSDRTKAIILPYPNNPTGAVLDRDTLEAIAEIAIKNDLIIISDEIYAELNYTGFKHVAPASLPEIKERCITINGFSKAFAMTGWRIGFVCAPKYFCNLMRKIHQYVIMCAPTASQYAAEFALIDGKRNSYSDIEYMKNSYNQRRRLVYKGLLDMGLECVEPMGAFYIFPSIAKFGVSSFEFCTELIKAKKVAAVPGTAFGNSGEGHIRISYATSQDKLITALDRIDEFIKERFI